MEKWHKNMLIFLRLSFDFAMGITNLYIELVQLVISEDLDLIFFSPIDYSYGSAYHIPY